MPAATSFNSSELNHANRNARLMRFILGIAPTAVTWAHAGAYALEPWGSQSTLGLVTVLAIVGTLLSCTLLWLSTRGVNNVTDDGTQHVEAALHERLDAIEQKIDRMWDALDGRHDRTSSAVQKISARLHKACKSVEVAQGKLDDLSALPGTVTQAYQRVESVERHLTLVAITADKADERLESLEDLREAMVRNRQRYIDAAANAASAGDGSVSYLRAVPAME
jgi:hypothetical protein